MSFYLTHAELVELMGYRQKARQVAWLTGNRFAFGLARDGTPRLARADYLMRMAGKIIKTPTVRPDWGALILARRARRG